VPYMHGGRSNHRPFRRTAGEDLTGRNDDGVRQDLVAMRTATSRKASASARSGARRSLVHWSTIRSRLV
jgi:hypothetical protein